MIRNIKRTWFEVWGEETAQNQILKALLLFVLVLTAVESLGLVWLAMRKPFIVTVSETATKAFVVALPNSELLERETKRVVSVYAKYRHEWEWTDIEKRIKNAATYIHPDFEKVFTKANVEQIKIARDKHVSQRFYFDESAIRLSQGKATVSGDRILVLDGLRITNPMTLEIEYQLGRRTQINPEGVYVTSERLISSQLPK